MRPLFPSELLHKRERKTKIQREKERGIKERER
jgi:hypothetical protein